MVIGHPADFLTAWAGAPFLLARIIVVFETLFVGLQPLGEGMAVLLLKSEPGVYCSQVIFPHSLHHQAEWAQDPSSDNARYLRSAAAFELWVGN